MGGVDAMLALIWQTSLAFAPYLLIGAVASGVLHVLLPSDWLRRHMQGRRGVLTAVLFGIPLPLCSCGVVPAGLGLRSDGASRGAAMGFMISTPQTGIDSILVSASMLGWPFALFKVVAALVTGLVGGLLTDRFVPEDGAGVGVVQHGADEQGSAFVRAKDHALMLLQSVWRWVVLGIVASAALEAWVPTTAWSTVAELPPLVAMGTVLVMSVPLYVCATASVPIAAALVAGGLPAGAAVVFLMAGPATNVATLGAVYRTLGLRTTLIYLSVVVVFSFGLGLGFDQLLPTAQATPHVHGSGQGWEAVAAGLLWALMAYFLVSELHAAWNARRKPKGAVLELPVEGLTCQGCVRKLQKTLDGDARVDFATVTLEPQHVRVAGRLSPSELAGLVEQAGFRPADAGHQGSGPGDALSSSSVPAS